jgi:hypothetical protein
MPSRKKTQAKRSWSKKPHEKRKAVLARFITMASARQKKRMPAHSHTHQLGTARAARWYLERTGASTKVKNLGELGALGHDIIRAGPGHALSSSKKMGKLLEKRLGRKPRARITGAMARHGVPAVKNGKRMPSDPVSDAVFFADRLECTGAYGVFRIAVSNGELPEYVENFRKLVLDRINKMPGFHDMKPEKQRKLLAEAERDAKIKIIARDARDSIMYNENPGFYKDRKPVDTVPAEKYFPKEVLPTLKRYDAELEEFISALEKRKPWALEIAGAMFAEGFKGQKEFSQIVSGFRPKTGKARQFKERALAYMKGRI